MAAVLDGMVLSPSQHEVSYTPKPSTRNRSCSTLCDRNAVSCV